MDNEQITGISFHAKLAIGLIVGLFILGGFLAFLIKYYELFSSVSQQVNNNPIQQQVNETAQPAVNYREQSKGVIDSYLQQIEADSSVDNLVSATNSVREELLSMRVSADDKAGHLAKVLL